MLRQLAGSWVPLSLEQQSFPTQAHKRRPKPPRYPSYPGFSLALVEEFDDPLDLDNARTAEIGAALKLKVSFGILSGGF